MTKTHTKRVLAALTASLLSLSLLAACGGQDSGKFCEYCGSPRPQ